MDLGSTGVAGEFHGASPLIDPRKSVRMVSITESRAASRSGDSRRSAASVKASHNGNAQRKRVIFPCLHRHADASSLEMCNGPTDVSEKPKSILLPTSFLGGSPSSSASPLKRKTSSTTSLTSTESTLSSELDEAVGQWSLADDDGEALPVNSHKISSSGVSQGGIRRNTTDDGWNKLRKSSSLNSVMQSQASSGRDMCRAIAKDNIDNVDHLKRRAGTEKTKTGPQVKRSVSDPTSLNRGRRVSFDPRVWVVEFQEPMSRKQKWFSAQELGHFQREAVLCIHRYRQRQIKMAMTLPNVAQAFVIQAGKRKSGWGLFTDPALHGDGEDEAEPDDMMDMNICRAS